jgi:hypothetical protein
VQRAQPYFLTIHHNNYYLIHIVNPFFLIADVKQRILISLGRLRPLEGAELLARLAGAGLLKDFNDGALFCASCGAQLDSQSVGVIVYDDSRKGFRKGLASCRDEKCIDELITGNVPSVFERPNDKK